MSFLESALELAGLGFHVFPLVPGSKLPLIEDFPKLATRDPKKIKEWWLDPVLELEQPFNVGISTSKFGDNEALVVVDVDNKEGKNGNDEILRLELNGQTFPETFEQATPTGGRHLVFKHPTALKQGSNTLAKGIDIRSRGGYIVGSGSDVAGRYSHRERRIESCPAWIAEICGKAPEPKAKKSGAKSAQSPRAISRATEYLVKSAPLAIEGDSGDQTTFQVAARVKDMGVDEDSCFDLLIAHWNERCSPPWSDAELKLKVENAYAYGANAIGSDAPETYFAPIAEDPTIHPFQTINKEYAFVIAGGGSHILWETKDHKGLPKLEHLGIPSFHQKLASFTMNFGDSAKPVSQLWMKSGDRRSYDGICFSPGLPTPPRFYNLWRGFIVEPLSKDEIPSADAQSSLDAFLEHAYHNVCHKDGGLYRWLIGYFAHIVQKPWEKPLVALVFRGKKGVGKNALIERVGSLLGNHFMVTSDRRYLVGNFNGHLENMLLFTLDEAFWSGDKQAEGVLKNLITGKQHVIEHKGKEPYTVDNCTRIIILGNEDWLVPATQDERRFAVFQVGDGRLQDRNFFRSMREKMEAGGYRLLLRYLMEYPLHDIDVNHAPATEGLRDQKINSMDLFGQWWIHCLNEGQITHSDFGGGWQQDVSKDRFRTAFHRYMKSRNSSSRAPSEDGLGRQLKSFCPSVNTRSKADQDGTRVNSYRLPTLEQARKEFEHYLGHPMNWDSEEQELFS